MPYPFCFSGKRQIRSTLFGGNCGPCGYVSFEVCQQGQTLGIIGENGAGKSTLLKILSRITQPTTGEVKVYGRLASLLEVRTGFNKESGRDNIFLNGTMLDFTKGSGDAGSRLDRIVEFSELAEFIDVPVKHYSTGISVRLAFSVAAHLNAEIVILDEVFGGRYGFSEMFGSNGRDHPGGSCGHSGKSRHAGRAPVKSDVPLAQPRTRRYVWADGRGGRSVSRSERSWSKRGAQCPLRFLESGK